MKDILIVGTDRGLGLALTQKFLQQGWNVTATVRKTDDATAVSLLNTEFEGKLNILNVDITHSVSVDLLCDGIGASRGFRCYLHECRHLRPGTPIVYGGD